MDGLDLFRKLGVGAKFNFSRFQNDAQKLRIVKSKVPAPVEETRTEIQCVDDDFQGAPVRTPVVDKLKMSENTNKRNIQEVDITDEDVGDDGDEQNEEALTLLGSMKSREHSDIETPSETRKKKVKKHKKRKKMKTAAELEAELQQEKVNHYRNKNRIHIYGTDVPDPVQTFDQLQQLYKLQSTIVTNIRSFGIEVPTSIQMQAMTVMLHQREILACAPTGSGKTLAFIVPVLHQLKCPQNKGFRAVVLSPTRELATQTHREFQRIAEGTGFRIHMIENGNKAAKNFGPNCRQKFDILVTTPNRLVYLLKQDPPQISLSNVEWLIVDESDKLFEAGKTGFRDQIAVIYKACDGSNVRRAMFSATFAYEVEEWCKLNLDNLVQVYIGAKNAASETIDQQLVFVGSESGKLVTVRDIVQRGVQPPILIFVQSKDRAKELFYDGLNVDVIHADRTQLQRDNIIKQFRAGNIWILLCTELMSRGIDFKGINIVINFDFPNSAISYIHRIGRTGRAGHTGKAITFFTEKDVENLRSIANVMREAGCPVPDYMLKLKKLDKRDRRKLARSAPERKSIRTIPQRDIEKARHKHHNLKKIKSKTSSKYGNK